MTRFVVLLGTRIRNYSFESDNDESVNDEESESDVAIER